LDGSLKRGSFFLSFFLSSLGSGIRQTTSLSPHTGHSMRLKSTRRTSAGEIAFRHFGHTASAYRIKGRLHIFKIHFLSSDHSGSLYAFRFLFATAFARLILKWRFCLWQKQFQSA
jgi:hypothetical protein